MASSPDQISKLNAALEGRYAIEREIGEGGMATVYLAHDERHNRNVALKVLKPELAAVVGAERFLAEIETTAQLTHPHILPLFDSGEADGFLFFVAPFIEGDTLRDRIDREKQLSVEEALEIAKKVASALDYAHQQGVVHRDIKPGNILLSERGEPTVADFGIALAVAQAGGGRVTETGLSVGTPHYMSPEQATGDRDVDPRTDVYALACVLYETLTGEPPYQGATAQAVLGRILTDPAPSPKQVRSSIPANVDAAIRKALEKLPADRFASPSHFAEALSDSGFRHGGDFVAAQGASPWNRPLLAATAAALAFALLAAWGWFGRPATRASPGDVSRLTLSLTGDHRLALTEFESLPLAVSPDGRSVAYVGESPLGAQLYYRPLSSFEPIPLAGTDEARQPFFSADGEWIAFFAGGDLLRVPVSGGAPIRVAELPLRPGTTIPVQVTGGTWGPGDVIVFASRSDLWRVGLTGEEPEPLSVFFREGDAAEAPASAGASTPVGASAASRVEWPSFLPSVDGGDGQDPHVLARVDGELSVISLADGSVLRLGVRATGHGVYAPSGHIVFTETTGEARAVPFDLASLSVTGAANPILEDVFRANQTAASWLAMSTTGTLVYVPGGSQRTLVMVDREGRERPLPFSPRPYRFPGLSPDGNLLAVNARGTGLMIMNLTTGAEFLHSDDQVVAWSPNGDEILHGSPPERAAIAPGSASEPLPQAQGSLFPFDWGTDGRVLLLNPDAHRDTQSGIFVTSIDSNEPAEVLIDTPYAERGPRRSPDGRWIAYASDVSGRQEVYIREFDGAGDPELVSINGGRNALWSRAGEELYYWKGEQVFFVRIVSTDPLEISSPEPLFTGRYVIEAGTGWDASPTGEFLLMSAGPNWLREIRVIQNFFVELGQAVVE